MSFHALSKSCFYTLSLHEETVLHSTLFRIAMDSLSFSTSPWKQCLWHIHCCVKQSIHRSNLRIWYRMIMSAWLCRGSCSWITSIDTSAQDQVWKRPCKCPTQLLCTYTCMQTHFFYRIFHCLFENVVFPIPIRASNVTKRTHSWANKGSQIATTIPRFGAPNEVERELKLTKTHDKMESEVKKQDLYKL